MSGLKRSGRGLNLRIETVYYYAGLTYSSLRWVRDSRTQSTAVGTREAKRLQKEEGTMQT